MAKELQDVDLHWFNHELNSSVHQNYIAPVVSSAIIIIAQLSENSKDDADHSEHFARAFTPQHARWSNGMHTAMVVPAHRLRCQLHTHHAFYRPAFDYGLQASNQAHLQTKRSLSRCLAGLRELA